MEVRGKFKYKILGFCMSHQIQIYKVKRFGKNTLYELEGDEMVIEKLIEYNDKLEKERKSKSLWYRLWN